MSMSALLPQTPDPRGPSRGRKTHELHDLRLMLAAFIGYAFRFASPVRAVRSSGELPPALERLALASQMRQRAWQAWTDESRTWFVTGEFADSSSDARALRTHFHDEDGRLAASATWMLDSNGRWQLWDR